MSNTVIIKSQSEWDRLPKAFTEFTVIRIESPASDWITVSMVPESSRVEAWESSSVEARGSSSVVAWESSRVVAWESSRVEARGSSSVVAWESSRVVAWESSRVVAWESSRVVAWESSRVVARESSSVEARGSSSVVARGSSSVVAWGSSSVVAWESSRVVARESSSVEAWESSRVVARESSSTHVQSEFAEVTLWAFAVAICLVKVKIKKKTRTCTVVNVPAPKNTTAGWLQREGVEVQKKKVILFKRVSKSLLTQENTSNETKWEINSSLTHPAWAPAAAECGPGKFHACGRPYLCDQFRSESDDRYIAIQVEVADLFVWPKSPTYPQKIAFRKGTVLHECNKWGEKL